MNAHASIPSALVLGGDANALSVARSLGRHGVCVHVSGRRGAPALRSRFCARRVPLDGRSPAEFWSELLLGGDGIIPEGSVLLPCDDEAVQFVALHHAVLRGRYRLGDLEADVHLAMLDKKRTLELAKSAGVPAPRFWEIRSHADVRAILPELLFPLIVKPVHSHLFQRSFGVGGRKHFTASSEKDLADALARALAAGVPVILVEKIPGPDDLLGSYYTYRDAQGRHLFHFTKKIIRRFPRNEGLACYHKTEWDEEIAAMGRRFFENIGFRGLGNVEFKRDVRDGRLKIIECNPRFTAAQELLVRSGVDAAWIVYGHAVGLPPPKIESYRQNLYFWYPVKDFRAYLDLRRTGDLKLSGWVRSLLRRQSFPYFSLSDPLPSIRRAFSRPGKIWRGRFD